MYRWIEQKNQVDRMYSNPKRTNFQFDRLLPMNPIHKQCPQWANRFWRVVSTKMNQLYCTLPIDLCHSNRNRTFVHFYLTLSDGHLRHWSSEHWPNRSIRLKALSVVCYTFLNHSPNQVGRANLHPKSRIFNLVIMKIENFRKISFTHEYSSNIVFVAENEYYKWNSTFDEKYCLFTSRNVKVTWVLPINCQISAYNCGSDIQMAMHAFFSQSMKFHKC